MMKDGLELINKVREKIPNKYEAMIVAARRARELNAGARPLVESAAAKPTTIALIEIAEGAIVSGPAKPRQITAGETDKGELLPPSELTLEDLDTETEEVITDETREIENADEDLDDDFDDDDITFDHIDIDDSFDEDTDDDDNFDDEE